MKKRKSDKKSSLRKKAEAHLAALPKPVKISKSDTASLIHELQVHQIELEMQNEELRQAQTVIENSNKRFSELYDFAPVGYITVEKEGRIIEANLMVAELLGMETTYLIGKPFNVFVYRDDQDVFFLHLRSLRKGVPRTCEIRLTKKNKTFFHTQLVSSPLAGSAEEYLIAVVDCTARKRAEEKTAQQYAILEAVVESFEGPIFSVDRDYRYLCFNSRHAKSMKTLFNANIEIGHNLLDYHAADDSRISAKMNIDKALGGESVIVESYAGEEARTRCYFETSNNPVRDSSGEVIGVAVFVNDLTEWKKAEVTRAHLASIIESSSDAIFSKTIEGVIQSWNASAERMCGFTEEEIRGRSVSTITPPDRAGEMKDIFQKIKVGELVRDFETVFRKKNGIDIPVSLTISPIKTSNGTIVGASAIARDITDRKAWERSLVDLNERLQDSNRELEVLGHTLSHDLRAPIQTIVLFSEIVLEKYVEKIETEGKYILQNINDNAVRVNAMVTALLNISRIERAKIRRKKIDVSALARAIVRQYREAEPDRDVEISIQENLFAEGDENLLGIALDNLVRNAWKFTRKRLQASIEFGTTESRGKSVFFLRDNGAGFNKKYADKMFVIFQRFHADAEFEGTGVGLATVERIIRRHGGRIWAEGEIDKGATFYFTVPCVPRIGKKQAVAG